MDRFSDPLWFLGTSVFRCAGVSVFRYGSLRFSDAGFCFLRLASGGGGVTSGLNLVPSHRKKSLVGKSRM